MVLVKWHLIHVAKDAPVDEVRDEAGQSSDSIRLYLVECHVNVLRRNLLGRIVERLVTVLYMPARLQNVGLAV